MSKRKYLVHIVHKNLLSSRDISGIVVETSPKRAVLSFLKGINYAGKVEDYRVNSNVIANATLLGGTRKSKSYYSIAGLRKKGVA